jgi:hypothetical protein
MLPDQANRFKTGIATCAKNTDIDGRITGHLNHFLSVLIKKPAPECLEPAYEPITEERQSSLSRHGVWLTARAPGLSLGVF